MGQDIFIALCATAGLIIAGDAVILMSALFILRIGDYGWMNRRNAVLLGIDILSGSMLILVASLPGSFDQVETLLALLLINIATNIYKTWEKLSLRPNRFCKNNTFFGFTLAKLGLTFVLFVGLLL